MNSMQMFMMAVTMVVLVIGDAQAKHCPRVRRVRRVNTLFDNSFNVPAPLGNRKKLIGVHHKVKFCVDYDDRLSVKDLSTGNTVQLGVFKRLVNKLILSDNGLWLFVVLLPYNRFVLGEAFGRPADAYNYDVTCFKYDEQLSRYVAQFGISGSGQLITGITSHDECENLATVVLEDGQGALINLFDGIQEDGKNVTVSLLS